MAGPSAYTAGLQNAPGGAGDAAGSALQTEQVVNQILGLKGTATEDQFSSQASDINSQGYAQEAAAYGNVGTIAQENAKIAGIAGDIKTYQEQRQLTRTLGTQRAAVAANGFGQAGSNLWLLRNSVQQGNIGRQLIGTQTALTEGGFLEQGAASQAQVAAADMASKSAAVLAAEQAKAGEIASANAAQETQLLKAFTGTTTPAQTGPAGVDPYSVNPYLPGGLGPLTVGSTGGLSGTTKSAGYYTGPKITDPTIQKLSGAGVSPEGAPTFNNVTTLGQWGQLTTSSENNPGYTPNQIAQFQAGEKGATQTTDLISKTISGL